MSSSTDFEIGRLYGPIKAIADVMVASQKDIFVRLPGLYAYFPGGIRDGIGSLRDHSGAGVSLTQIGTVPTGYDGNSYIHLGDGTNYFSGSGFGVITGTEAWIESSLRGLTIGGWFFIEETPGLFSGLISRDGAVTDYGYSLTWRSDDKPSFTVSSNGSALTTVMGGVASVGAWHFIVGRFSPSVEAAVFLDGVKAVTTVSVPASVNGSSQAFEVGRYRADGSRIIHARARDIFVCAAALSDELIEEVRRSSVP